MLCLNLFFGHLFASSWVIDKVQAITIPLFDFFLDIISWCTRLVSSLRALILSLQLHLLDLLPRLHLLLEDLRPLLFLHLELIDVPNVVATG